MCVFCISNSIIQNRIEKIMIDFLWCFAKLDSRNISWYFMFHNVTFYHFNLVTMDLQIKHSLRLSTYFIQQNQDMWHEIPLNVLLKELFGALSHKKDFVRLKFQSLHFVVFCMEDTLINNLRWHFSISIQFPWRVCNIRYFIIKNILSDFSNNTKPHYFKSYIEMFNF